MQRMVAVPAALAVVVAVPVIIGQLPQKEAPPAARAASLKLAFTGDERSDHKLIVEATGRPPGEALLTSEDGTQTALVRGLPDAQCNDVTDVRSTGYTGAEPALWCLRLERLPGHAQISGTAAGSADAGSSVGATELSLTVTTRDSLFWWPALVILAGFLIGGLLTPARTLLGKLVTYDRLALLLQRNRSAPERVRIAGLDDYVRARRAADAPDATIRGEVEPVVRQGPEEALVARNELRQALGQHELPADHPYRRAAFAEAVRTDHEVSDFLAGDGTAVAHPAKRLATGLEPMVDYGKRLDAAEAEIADKLKAQCQAAPMQAVAVARLRWERVAAAEDVASLEKPFAAMRDAIDDKLATANCRKAGVTGASAGWTALVAAVTAPALPSAPSLEAGRLGALTLALSIVTVLFVLVALAFAFFTVAQATYESNATFGSVGDYFALFSAALASGVAATVVALFAPWSTAKPAGATED